MAVRYLTAAERYAAGGLFALALRQVQIHQTLPLGLHLNDDQHDGNKRGVPGGPETSGCERVEDQTKSLWVHESCGLLCPVFRHLDIDPKTWNGLEKTEEVSSPKNHFVDFLKMLSEETCDRASETLDQLLALAKSVDAIVMRSQDVSVAPETMERKSEDAKDGIQEVSRVTILPSKLSQFQNSGVNREILEAMHAEDIMEAKVTYQCKLAVMFELLSACVLDASESDKKDCKVRKGYDARHRVALRLLAALFDFRWNKMEALELIISSSSMASINANEAQSEVDCNDHTEWAKWKQGGMIGAAALTGGTLLAITGGLAAPAIAAGFGALAPALGSGFAAVASAAGSVAGSVAVAASFGGFGKFSALSMPVLLAAGPGLAGTKMARRIADIDEFEFKTIGGNHNHGHLAVGIMVSGFVFEDKDFVEPWESQSESLEGYALQWESKHLIAISTAIQDWLTSSITMELMRQGAMLTVLGSLVTALAWPSTLLAATNFIDSKWAIAIDRSDKAGKLLSEVLLNGLHGNRPVTLMGFSLGARVVFKCLQHLAEAPDSAGIVERVVLIGALIPLNAEEWETVRQIVAGRFVNVYSTNDWILGIASHASLFTDGLAGIQAVTFPGIENVSRTDFDRVERSKKNGTTLTVHQIKRQPFLEDRMLNVLKSYACPCFVSQIWSNPCSTKREFVCNY